MNLTTKYLSFLFLTAALTASVAPKAVAAQEVVVRVDHPRYYDSNHRDYHEWNDREDHSYRVYLGEYITGIIVSSGQEIAAANRAITGIGAIATRIATSSIIH